jgi:hypothetical protein
MQAISHIKSIGGTKKNPNGSIAKRPARMYSGKTVAGCAIGDRGSQKVDEI